MNTKAHS